MIILRYLAKEIVKTSLAVLLILLLVAILNKFSSLIAKAALGEIPPYLLFELILLLIPELLAFLMPLSLFLGILLAFGKLYAEQEMVAYFACGFGWKGLTKVAGLMSFIVLFLVAVLTLWGVPVSQNARESALAGQKISLALQTLTPGKFHQVPGKKMVFYFESKDDETHYLEKLFIAEEGLTSGALISSKTIIAADQGKAIEKDGFWYLELQKGHQYKANEVLHFEKYGKLLDSEPAALPSQYHRNMPTMQLFSSKQPSYLAELQWRLSMPLTAPVLAIWGLCLSRVSPREGRFGKILPAIFIFIVYFQLLSLSKRWIVAGVLPGFIGVWWVHLMFAAVGILWLLQQSGYWQRQRYAQN